MSRITLSFSLLFIGFLASSVGCANSPLPFPDLGTEDLAGRDLATPPDLAEPCNAQIEFVNLGDIEVQKNSMQTGFVSWTYRVNPGCALERKLTNLEFTVTTDMQSDGFDVHMDDSCLNHMNAREAPIPGGYHLDVPLGKWCVIRDNETDNIQIFSVIIPKGTSHATISLKRMRTCDLMDAQCEETRTNPSTVTTFIKK